MQKFQSRYETLIPEEVICDEILTINEEVAVTQEILTGEMIVAEMRTDESDANEEEEKEDEQEGDVSLMEKPNASQIHEELNSLFNLALITSKETIQHIAIKTSKAAEMKLTRTAQQSYITSYFA